MDVGVPSGSKTYFERIVSICCYLSGLNFPLERKVLNFNASLHANWLNVEELTRREIKQKMTFFFILVDLRDDRKR